MRQFQVVFLLVGILCIQFVQVASQGHALLFHNDKILKKSFDQFPSTELTIEVWISSSYYCNPNAIFSYALDSKEKNSELRSRDFNHFVVFDTQNVIACVDYPQLILSNDPYNKSCISQYGKDDTANFVTRDGAWHHLAVTWRKSDGATKIYQDGLLMSSVIEHNSRPLQSGGSFMLGAEQDCYGGCIDTYQGFYGLMDEVRLWNVVRSREQIVQSMRLTDLDDKTGLVAFWKFDDPDTNSGLLTKAHDYSGNGNDLDLKVLPLSSQVTIDRSFLPSNLDTYALEFSNGYAIKPDVTNMPDKDITVEFWAKTPALPNVTTEAEEFGEFFSFASVKPGNEILDDQWGPDLGFIDDAFVIEKYMSEFNGRKQYFQSDMNTKGSISVHINANREGNGLMYDHWLDFKCDWLDDQWHHIAVTWEYETGVVHLYFDAEEKVPFWRSSANSMTDATVQEGGVENFIAKQSQRSKQGSLVLGQQQESFGGGFSPFFALAGSMAVLRVWDRVLSKKEILNNMYLEKPTDDSGLIMMYNFQARSFDANIVPDLIGSNDLLLGAPGPQFISSTAPLTDKAGLPVATPKPGSAGFAMHFSDRQVLSVSNFKDFPSTQITVEFWMLSYDNCRRGVPFSYATGEYKNGDNSFLIFNYNNWGVSVMEDEGSTYDHEAGIGAADGLWHYVAVTWSSSDGAVSLYQDGKRVWRVKRAQGKSIAAGGALVIGREQDCIDGCFDSAEGSIGKIETGDSAQYGAQDFFGYIDEIRIWKRALSSTEIQQNMLADKDQFSVEGRGSYKSYAVDNTADDLVAYYTFNEGQGYIVKDVTGKGHDLYASENVDWVPVIWNSECGNYKIEAGEQCDDGNTRNGDGCSSSCTIEFLWTCNGEPSLCQNLNIFSDLNIDTYLNSEQDMQLGIPSPSPIGSSYSPEQNSDPKADPFLPPTASQIASQSPVSIQYAYTDDNKLKLARSEPQASPSPPTSSQEQSKSKGGSAATVVAIVLVILVLLIIALAVFIFRERIYEQFPGVHRRMQDMQSGVRGFRAPAGPLGAVAVAVDNKDISAEFATPSEYTPLKGEDLKPST